MHVTDDPVATDPGTWLVEHRADLDRAEALWLERLAEFDRDGLWALDGHLCCASWLAWRTRMARSTAFEKLRVAHELARRPVIAAAFRAGDLSYLAVRALTRMERPDPEVDRALVEAAASGQVTISDLEKLVRSYHLYADQERPPGDDRRHRRDVRILRGPDGTGRLEITLDDYELEEVAAVLQAFLDQRYRPRPGDESSAGDTPEAPLEEAGRAERRADAFMDLVNVALAGANGGHAAGDDRYMVHVLRRQDDGTVSLLDGTPLDPADAALICCDASTVRHQVAESGEPLNLGRKTRDWNISQRRALGARDGGRCRFPGCQYRHYDIHHMEPWEEGGRTDIDNGLCECRRHHRKLHRGYTVEGDPNGELRFHRPDGSYIGSTWPAAARRRPR